MLPKKCSRDNCPTQNTAKDLTVKCRRCRCEIHLLCYGIGLRPEEIPDVRNILILCDECLDEFIEQPSPKRKVIQPNFVQLTIDGCKLPPTNDSPSNKISSVKPTTQKLIESLHAELKNNTATISALKSSVDSMHGTINQQKVSLDESIKSSLTGTHSLIESIKKQSYSNILKGVSNRRNDGETPKSSRTPSTSVRNQPKVPAVSGTSTNVLGKPLSPITSKPKVQRKMPEKAVWISKLHRDTSEEEILLYVKEKLGIAEVDRLEIRKLVKKDRDISTYSFVSFKIGCPANLLDTLLDVKNWPQYCQIREFNLEMTASVGAKLNGSPAKNDQATSHVNHTLQQPTTTETV